MNGFYTGDCGNRGLHLGERSFDRQMHSSFPVQLVRQIRRGVTGHNLAAIDNNDPLTELTNFGQNMAAQDNGVVAGQLADKFSDFPM